MAGVEEEELGELLYKQGLQIGRREPISEPVGKKQGQ